MTIPDQGSWAPRWAGGTRRAAIDSVKPIIAAGAGIFSASLIASLAGALSTVIATRLYQPRDVAVAGSIISLSTLAVSIGDLGLTTLILQHLRATDDRPGMIGSVYGMSVFFGVLSSLALLPIIPGHQLVFDVAFPVLSVAGLLFGVHEAACFAFGLSGYVARRSFVTQVLRIAGLVLLVPLGARGIVGSLALVTVVMVLWLHYRVLVPRAGQPRYSVTTLRALLHSMGRFMLANYITEWTSWAPFALFPALVLRLASAEDSAVGYVVLMIATTALAVPGAVIIAEFTHRASARDQHGLRAQAVALILIGAVVVCAGSVVVARPVLAIFGHAYRSAGVGPLVLLSLAIPLQAVRRVFVAECRLRGWLGAMVGVSIVSAVVVIGLVMVGAADSGLRGASIGWLVGQCISVLGVAVAWLRLCARFGFTAPA